MESLKKMLDEIHSNYEVRFIVEQVTFDQDKPVYRLKRRKVLRFLGRKKFVDDYETNSISKRINFKNQKEIEQYLRFQFSEPEGFMSNVIDINNNEEE